MITIKEIAKECNVSPTTVSNILNGKPKVGEETKARVLEVVNRRGYRPNYIAGTAEPEDQNDRYYCGRYRAVYNA